MNRIAVFLILTVIASNTQSFTNISFESFSVLKYEVATDLAHYSRPAVLEGYLKITNTTDTTLFFQTPSPNFCYFRVTKGGLEVDEFPLVTLPVIGSFTLRPNESLAETVSWNISPAVWDTSYRFWGILNIATSWSPFPKDSHFVEFSIGEVGIEESPFQIENAPLRGFEHAGYELFDLTGRRIGYIDMPTENALSALPSGGYFLRPRGAGPVRKVVVIR